MIHSSRFFLRLLVLLPVVSVLGTTGCSRQSSDTPTTESSTTEVVTATSQSRNVRTEVVALSAFRRTVETTGTVAFNQNRSTQVLSPISGPVTRILAETGTRVGKGQALAIVSSPDFSAAMSAFRKSEATARNARRIADLDRQLFKNDAISRRDVEQADTDAVAAEADRDSALQQLRSLGVDEKTIGDIQQNRPVANLGGVIRSPLSGTVVEKLVTPGQLLQAGTTPCFTVADLSSVWVMANVFEADLPFVSTGDQAEVMSGSSLTGLPGRVDYIAALVDPNTRAVSVRLDVANPGATLKRDLYVRVAIHSQRETQGILVPVSAVLRDEENLPFVFVSKADGTFARRRVQTGVRIGERQEITSGLTAGESIVVEGGLFLSAAGQQ